MDTDRKVMTVKVKDFSVTQIAPRDEIYISIKGGRIEYELNLRCAHEHVVIEEGDHFNPREVICHDCDDDYFPDEEILELLTRSPDYAL